VSGESERSKGNAPRGGRRIDGSLLFFASLAVVSGLLVLWLKGWPTLLTAMRNAAVTLATIAPAIAIGLYLGGLAKGLADPEKIAPVLGARSGWRGLFLASALGAVTPGGPFAAFPIVYALFLAGADVGAVIAYVTAWSLIALHRVVVWELPLLGIDFTLIRVVSSLPLPILAGALARLIARGPLEVQPPATPPSEGRQ
jgi:uncharacterized membrane protein YraQ (UPF0718 family)